MVIVTQYKIFGASDLGELLDQQCSPHGRAPSLPEIILSSLNRKHSLATRQTTEFEQAVGLPCLGFVELDIVEITSQSAFFQEPDYIGA